MANWLSFWNQETRAHNAKRLAGRLVSEIYVPYGRDKIGRGDRIYCMGIEDGQLRLITRVRAAQPEGDEVDDEMIYIDNTEEERVEADFDRVVPGHVVAGLRILYADGSENPIKRGSHGRVEGTAYQGRASIRELTEGADELDALLG